MRVGLRVAKTRRTKYGATKTTVDGITFDSKREARRYGELKVLAQAERLHDLELQPKWDLHAFGGTRIGAYRADFSYCTCVGGTQHCDFSQPVIEDAKGFRTPLYRWKKKHVEAEYGIQIREV